MMCGIVGLTGKDIRVKELVKALKKLEYRGYDSAGIAFQDKENVYVKKEKGRILNLENMLGNINEKIVESCIAHTRWATHGEPSELNAHPHTDCTGKIAVVHNGIIENYMEIKHVLIEKGHRFSSETDTEVIAHLIEEYYFGDLQKAVSHAILDLCGAYAIAVIHNDHPGEIVAARKGSPLVLGKNDDKAILASDVTPALKYTREMIFLEDGDIAHLSENRIEIFSVSGAKIHRQSTLINWDEESAEKGGFEHFMLKEIFDEPQSIRSALMGKISDEKVVFKELNSISENISKTKKINVIACGTSYHAGLIFKKFVEDYANIEVEIDVASEFRYKNNIIGTDSIVIAISQSGETTDTLEGVRKAKSKGAKIIAITNIVGSTISREADAVIYLNAGLEIGVAATKTYVTQLTILYLLGTYIAALKNVSKDKLNKIILNMMDMPTVIENILSYAPDVCLQLAKEFYKYKHFMYIGRGYSYPSALEGALKLKEISYIHASAYQAGELKHGPIALLDDEFPVFAIVPDDELKKKTLSNVIETKARNAKIVGICTEGDKEVSKIINSRIEVPKIIDALYPLTMSPFLQLFAYYVSILRKYDPDKPRNLAKSVTVE